MLYNMCGLNVYYEPKYKQTITRSEKYLKSKFKTRHNSQCYRRKDR